MHIGEVIRTNRVMLGKRQWEVGQVLFKDESYVSRLENGRIEPGPEEIQKIAEFLESEALECIAIGMAIRSVLKKEKAAS